VLTEALIAMLFAASLHAMMGPGGMASFGHAAWFGIGAYAAALAARGLSMPMPVGLLLGWFLAGATALAFGWFVVRLSGIYFAMLTLAFAQIVWAVAFQSAATGGDNGVLGVWPDAWARDPRVFYGLALVLCVGGTLALRRVLFSPFGYALRAARDAPERAEAIGLFPAGLRMAACTLAGAAAGLAGAVGAYSNGSVFPTTISIGRSVDALLMVLLGGVQTMSGPVVGALVYTGLYDVLIRLTDLWRLVLGLAIIALVLAFPQGIAGAAQRFARGAS
jgi:branched-chain amino acid transport system permease protein